VIENGALFQETLLSITSLSFVLIWMPIFLLLFDYQSVPEGNNMTHTHIYVYE